MGRGVFSANYQLSHSVSQTTNGSDESNTNDTVQTYSRGEAFGQSPFL